MGEECAICFNEIVERCALTPCQHAYCRACVRRILRFDVRCPTCRVAIEGFRPPIPVDATLVISVTLSPDRKYGITLANAPDGVLVKSVGRGSAAARVGLRKNDVILSINGVPSTTQKTALLLLAHASLNPATHLAIRRRVNCGCLP